MSTAMSNGFVLMMVGMAVVFAALSLLLWLGVVMAGRWIAYSDYIFWPE